MTAEKKILLDKIDYLINKRKVELLNEIPSVHEIADGFIVRFFTEWDNCEDDNNIKYKKIVNKDNLDESIVFFYIPKDSIFQLKQRFYIGDITCLSGGMEINIDDEVHSLNNYTKISVNSDNIEGKALENTYIVTTSNRLDWSEFTRNYVKVNKF